MSLYRTRSCLWTRERLILDAAFDTDRAAVVSTAYNKLNGRLMKQESSAMVALPDRCRCTSHLTFSSTVLADSFHFDVRKCSVLWYRQCCIELNCSGAPPLCASGRNGLRLDSHCLL
jgi:hypothetical protein